MRLSLLTASLAATALAIPNLSSRQSDTIVTQGTQGTGNQNRLEIRDMHDNQPLQWSLFLLALQEWKSQSQTADGTYWGISKIHGVPRQTWNNVNPCPNCGANGGADGYCCHGCIYFPCWHRAYMALFEQEFLKIVQNIANSWSGSNKAQVQQAANEMRWPYFDWAIEPADGVTTVPETITDILAIVNGPNGQETLYNPLATFNFDNPSNMVYQYFTNWHLTLRYPNSNDPNAQSQQQMVNQTFTAQRQNIRDQIYTLLTGCDNYQQFSNINGNGQGACAGSLEGVHDTVHNNFGGLGGNGISGGHMTYLAESAFDPTFWLHHGMIDRIFALWQAMHTDYTGSQNNAIQNWAVAANEPLNLDSNLYPFRRDNNGNFWTCNYVKDWKTFNYNYAEFTTTDGSAGSIKNIVDNLYGPNANGRASAKRDAPGDIGDVVNGLTNSIGEALLTPFVAKNGSTFQYFVNIKVPKFGGDGSMNIIAFQDGPASEDSTTWNSDRNLIGSMGVLAQPGMSHDMMSSGSIPLTTWLTKMQQQGAIKDLSEVEVIPYLQKHLRMRIQGLSGKTFKPSDLKGFQANVFSSTRQPEQNFLKDIANFFSEFIELPELTDSLFQGA